MGPRLKPAVGGSRNGSYYKGGASLTSELLRVGSAPLEDEFDEVSGGLVKGHSSTVPGAVAGTMPEFPRTVSRSFP